MNARREKIARKKTPASKRPLWKCPKCGKWFVTANMWHSCGNHTVAQFFAGKDPKLKALYSAFAKFVRRCGPYRVDPARTRIAFQGRVRFAGVASATKDSLIVGFWLKRRIDSPRFMRVDQFKNDFVYKVRLTDARQLDAEFLAWIREAYDVGQQKHLERPRA